MLTKEKKQQIIADNKINKGDTGSADVQIMLLTKNIEEMQKHLKKHKKDEHSRRGLLKMVIKRKRLSKYLERNDKKRYDKIVKKAGLKV